MLEKIKEIWGKLTAKCSSVLDKWGTSKETGKLHLGGWLMVGFSGAITAPFRLIGGAYTAGRLLSTNPTEAWLYLRFQGVRLGQGALAMIGVYFIDHPETSYRDAYREIKFGRAIGFAYVAFFGFIFAPIFIEAGLINLGIFFLIAPTVVWIISGLGAMIERWRSYRWATWRANIVTEQLTARARSVQEQMAAQENLAEAMATVAIRENQITKIEIEGLSLGHHAEAARLSFDAESDTAKEQKEDLKLLAAEIECPKNENRQASLIEQMAARVSGAPAAPMTDVKVSKIEGSLKEIGYEFNNQGDVIVG